MTLDLGKWKATKQIVILAKQQWKFYPIYNGHIS